MCGGVFVFLHPQRRDEMKPLLCIRGLRYTEGMIDLRTLLLAALCALVIVVILALLGVIDTHSLGFGFPDGP